jgi:alpha-glucuronidase
MNKAICSGILLAAAAVTAGAQTAELNQAWLKYNQATQRLNVPTQVRTLGSGAVELSAKSELERGLLGMMGKIVLARNFSPFAIVLGTDAEMANAHSESKARRGGIAFHNNVKMSPEWRSASAWAPAKQEFAIERDSKPGSQSIFISSPTEQGLVYGTFALLRMLAQGEDVPAAGVHEAPSLAVRWTDEWDNADGSIERGFAGRSIFFDGGHVREDLSQVREYARLLASVGINGCNLNNVNNAAAFLEPKMLRGIVRIADAMRPWGVRVALSVDIASPQKIGGLPTYDPLDPAVIAWWQAKTDEIYKLIPDFAGFTVKADSEGQPGPASYGRTPADAANLVANALAPHGGVVLYRAFVYDHHLDWKNPKADRARAAYDIFHPLDGKFAANVIVQTKEGPVDFQAREPVSPLFAGIPQTSQAMEVQITQEYTGQQRHLVYLAPMWKEVLDFDLRADNRATPVKEILAGKSFGRPLSGMIGVSGIGQQWLGSPLAMANLYAFGRLAWNPELAPEKIADEWTRLTINSDATVVSTVTKMLMQSWPAYEHYTGPLGMQTLTGVVGTHYGPDIEASENNGWGQWHRADAKGVGMDRSVATGTGYAGQYPPEVAKMYESAATTPDELLTFFHHVPYTYKLHDGKTVIQYIYDSHYQGAEEAAALGREWAALKGKIDDKLYNDMAARLEYQAGHAIVWRDAIVQYFWKLSGIADAQGRAGSFPGRLEAEDAKLSGYTVVDVKPWEDASRGKAVTCAVSAGCAAEWTYNGTAGQFDVAVQYFDLPRAVAHFTLSLNGQALVSWAANATLPNFHTHGDNSTRFTYRGVGGPQNGHGLMLKPGDVIRVEGVPADAPPDAAIPSFMTPNKSDPAALDYIELVPVQ